VRATFVGTGDAFSRRFGHTNVLIEAGDICAMLDFGHLAPQRLEDLGYSLGQLTHVIVSHIHADHIGGLEELAFVSRFVHQYRPKLLAPLGLSGLLWQHSLRGGLEMIADDEGQARHCALESYFEVEELEESWHSLGPISVLPFRTDHVPGKDSWGFVVRDEETDDRMIFGCDTRTPHPQLMAEPIGEDFARGPIFHDCQLMKGGVSAIHVPLGKIHYPEGVQERIVVVHYSDRIEEHLDRIEEAGLKIAYPGDVISMPDWQAGLGAGRTNER
jgi:hypothetical protein